MFSSPFLGARFETVALGVNAVDKPAQETDGQSDGEDQNGEAVILPSQGVAPTVEVTMEGMRATVLRMIHSDRRILVSPMQ